MQYITKKHLRIAEFEVMPELNNSRPSFNKYTFTKTLLILTAIIAISALASYQYFAPKKNTQDVNNNINHIADAKTVNIDFIPATAQRAWDKYFKLWDTQIDKNWRKPQCPNNHDTGMACLRRQGNLNQIEKLNRPVLLQLEDNSLILLSAINNDKIGILNDNDKTILLNKSWLEQQWLGTYFIIWPMPAYVLSEPSQTQMQTWSLEMANTIANTTVSSTQLTDWIIAFQQKNGLLADGIIGSETQMALSLNAYNGPTLK